MANLVQLKFCQRTDWLTDGLISPLYSSKIYALDFIQTHVNLEFDTCIFTGVEKYIIFDRDYERYNSKLKY